jgi:hypothetical protein
MAATLHRGQAHSIGLQFSDSIRLRSFVPEPFCRPPEIFIGSEKDLFARIGHFIRPLRRRQARPCQDRHPHP